MCGIAGVYRADPDRPVSEEILAGMRVALEHRGPDDRGVFLDGPVGLCHTRLAILDLSARAHQPMLSADGRYALSYNGEVYNFRELRRELESAGCTFRSSSDTEVVLQMLAREGESGICRLEGMFAFAFYDREQRSLLLVRDRLGIKPLFWVRSEDGVFFASEPKALPQGCRRRSPDAARIAEYLAFRHLAERESLQPDVETLLPGHLLRVRGREVSSHRWWWPRASAQGDPNATADVLRRSVERQLVSDVPVGVFLSGGVDSALVTAAAADAHQAIDTFTVGFEEQGWDESDRARLVSDACGTKQRVVRLGPDNYAADLAKAIWHLDSPLNHAHSVHLLELSRVARQQVTVVLTGEGGDELFAGYPRYRLFLASRLLQGAPGTLLRSLARLVRHGRPRLARLLSAASSDDAYAAALNPAFVPLDDAAKLAGLWDPEDALQPRRRLAEEAIREGGGPTDALLALERQTYLVSLLQRMDRMSMAAGLECRVPFLDEGVFAFATSLSTADRLRLSDSKIPLRRAAERRFGSSYAHAPKFGFGVPLDAWFRGDGPVAQALSRVLEERRTRERGWVDVDLGRAYLSEHRSGRRDRTEALWGLLNLELWARVCLDGAGAEDVLESSPSA